MKVVINTCYGGFGLSDTAMSWLAKRKNMKCVTSRGEIRWLHPTCEGDVESVPQSKYTELLASHKMNRSDPDLIAVVEELGDAASDNLAKLRVVEIPDGVEYHISDYDGVEHVAEKHRTWS